MIVKQSGKISGALNNTHLPDQKRTVMEIYNEIQSVYLNDDRPWVIGYSGGKDSTTALQLTWYAIASLPRKKRTKPVYVISSDTLVETPAIADFIDESLERINEKAKEEDLPFQASKVRPIIEETFWVNLLGRGYPAPSTTFRWCTDRIKIRPADRFILNKISKHQEVVLLLGVRKGESATRDQVINMHKIEGTLLSRHSRFPQTYVYTPVVNFSLDDIWMYLIDFPNPWGNDNQELVELYRASNAGECPLVVDDTTPPCGNSRFGCWTCTVIAKDKTMESLVEGGESWLKPLLDFRNMLSETQIPEKKQLYRDFKRRNGKAMMKNDKTGIVRGPYTFEFRRELLRHLLIVQKEVREKSGILDLVLIQPDELHEIRRIWRLEGDWQDHLPQIYREIMDEELSWIQDDGALFDYRDAERLEGLCAEYDIPAKLVIRLIDVERRTQGMARRSNIYKNLSKVLREEWRSEEEVIATFPLIEEGRGGENAVHTA